MQWIAQTGKDADTTVLEHRLLDVADHLRVNVGIKSRKYSGPSLGLIYQYLTRQRLILNATNQ